MEIIYNIDSRIELSSLERTALIKLYQPLFAYNALALYMTLLHVDSPISNQNIIKLTHDNFDSFNQKKVELERFGLLATYINEDIITLSLRRPLEPRDFLDHAMFGRLYTVVMGQPLFSKQRSIYASEKRPDFGRDVSTAFDAGRLAAWNESYEEAFVSDDVVEVGKSFDVVAFFRTIPDILFPVQYRTQEVRDLVEELGSLYKIDFETMKTILVGTINPETGEFNRSRFIYAIESNVGRMKVDPQNPYDVDPVSFLRFKQGFDYVGSSDQNLLDSMKNNFGFSNEVLNFLVEYVLETNEGNLGRAFVEKIAGTWKRKNVTTLQEARNQIVSEPRPTWSKKPPTKALVPTYSKDTSIDEDESDIQEAIMKMLNKGES